MIAKRFALLIMACCMALNMATAQQPETKVTLGIKPDYWYNANGDGVKIKDVIAGQPAQQCGLKADDIITAFDGKSIKNIFAYKDMLDHYKPGDSVKITALRDKKPYLFRARFPK